MFLRPLLLLEPKKLDWQSENLNGIALGDISVTQSDDRLD